VPKGVEVRDPIVVIAVREEVRCFSLLLLLQDRCLLNPYGTSSLQIAFDEVHRGGVLRPVPRPEGFIPVLASNPAAKFGDKFGVQWNLIAAAVLGVRGLDDHHRRIGIERE
jgi:hypothetical protein